MSVWQGLLDTILTGADEAAMPSVRKFAKGVARFAGNNSLAQTMIRGVNPKTLDIVRSIGPTAVSGMMGAVLKDDYFPNSRIAHLVKGGISDFFVELAEQTAPGKKPDPAVVEQVGNKVLADMLVYANRLIHLKGCPEITGKRTKVDLEMALSRQYFVAPCCFPELQLKLQKPEKTESKPDEPITSALDAVSEIEDPARRDLVLVWLTERNQSELAILRDHLNTKREAERLADLIELQTKPEKVLELIVAQSQRSRWSSELAEVSETVKNTACEIGTAAIGGVKDAGSWLDKEAMGPLADGLESVQQCVNNRAQNPQAPKQLGLWGRIKRAFRIF